MFMVKFAPIVLSIHIIFTLKLPLMKIFLTSTPPPPPSSAFVSIWPTPPPPLVSNGQLLADPPSPLRQQ